MPRVPGGNTIVGSLDNLLKEAQRMDPGTGAHTGAILTSTRAPITPPFCSWCRETPFKWEHWLEISFQKAGSDTGELGNSFHLEGDTLRGERSSFPGLSVLVLTCLGVATQGTSD